MASKPLGSLLYIEPKVFQFLIDFNHTRYSQFQSLSVLATILVAFAQVPLGLQGDQSWRVWGEGFSGLEVGAVAQAQFCKN